jgi:hypothetical protein
MDSDGQGLNLPGPVGRRREAPLGRGGAKTATVAMEHVGELARAADAGLHLQLWCGDEKVIRCGLSINDKPHLLSLLFSSNAARHYWVSMLLGTIEFLSMGAPNEIKKKREETWIPVTRQLQASLNIKIGIPSASRAR